MLGQISREPRGVLPYCRPRSPTIREPTWTNPPVPRLEAAAFRGLVAHLRERTDVQNIDLMNLAGFCRNCLSKWYMAAADGLGVEMNYDEAREIVYGMTYDQWKRDYQKEASEEQKAAFETTKPLHAKISGHQKG